MWLHYCRRTTITLFHVVFFCIKSVVSTPSHRFCSRLLWGFFPFNFHIYEWNSHFTNRIHYFVFFFLWIACWIAVISISFKSTGKFNEFYVNIIRPRISMDLRHEKVEWWILLPYIYKSIWTKEMNEYEYYARLIINQRINDFILEICHFPSGKGHLWFVLMS